MQRLKDQTQNSTCFHFKFWINVSYPSWTLYGQALKETLASSAIAVSWVCCIERFVLFLFWSAICTAKNHIYWETMAPGLTSYDNSMTVEKEKKLSRRPFWGSAFYSNITYFWFREFCLSAVALYNPHKHPCVASQDLRAFMFFLSMEHQKCTLN